MADDPTDPTAEPLETDPAGRAAVDREVALEISEQDAQQDDDEFPPPRDLSREVALVGAALSVVAGVLCIVAPFRAVYTLRAQGISASFDGWGRYDLASGSQHGPRYGIALTVAALVLVVAAASRLRDLRPLAADDTDTNTDTDTADVPVPPATGLEAPATTPPADDRLAAGVGVAGSALLLGVLASVALSIESTVSNADSIAASGGGPGTAVDVGGMLWFLLGAWVVSVAAVYLPWFEARRRR